MYIFVIYQTFAYFVFQCLWRVHVLWTADGCLKREFGIHTLRCMPRQRISWEENNKREWKPLIDSYTK